MTDDDRVDWFLRNKISYTPHKKHAFDDAGRYEESSRYAKVSGRNDLYKYLPMDDWILREMSWDKCGEGTLKDKLERGKKLYDEVIMDRQVPNKFAGGGGSGASRCLEEFKMPLGPN